MNYNEIEKNKAQEDSEEVITKKKVTPVAKGRKPKKNLLSRVSDILVGPEGFKSIGNSVINDIVVPALKETAHDALQSAISSVFYKNDAPVKKNNYYRGSTNYTNYYRGNTPAKPNTQSSNTQRGVKTYADIYAVPNRHEAIMILDNLRDQINQYGSASLADYYEYLSVETHNYIDNSWGWTNLDSASIRATREGFIIDLPKLEVM